MLDFRYSLRPASAVKTKLKVNVSIDSVDLLARFNEKAVRLKTNTLFQTADNIKLLDDCVENVTLCVKWAPYYNFAKVQANGYWSVALYINKLMDYVLIHDKNVEPLIPVIGFFNRWFQYVRDERENDSTHGKLEYGKLISWY